MAILIALIPALAWGSIGLVSGKLGGNAYQQTLGMTLGALVFGIATWLVMHPVLNTKIWLLGILSGLFWALGQTQQFTAMKSIGVSMTVPMSTGMQLVANTLAGALLFAEWKNGKQTIMGLLALFLLVMGAVYSSRREKGGRNAEDMNFGAGIRALIISTIGYAGYTIVVNAGHMDATSVVLPQAVGMVTGALLFAIGHDAFKKATAKNILTGVLWGTGNVFMVLAMTQVGLAISFSISQSGILISTFGSIYLLNEHKTRKEMRWVIIGSVLIILGVVVLALMK